MKERETSQARTEPPTHRRLRDLRRKGQVATSRDIPATVAMVAGILFLMLAGGHLIERLQRVLDQSAGVDLRMLAETTVLMQWTRGMLLEVVWMTLPVAALTIISSVLAGIIQVGPVLASEQVKPQLKRINPVTGIRRLLSARTAVELCKLLVKATVLAVVVWFTVRQALPVLLKSHWLPLSGVLPLALQILAILCWSVMASFLAIAIFDLWFQKWDFLRRNRMSIEEVRRERKETDGDPHIRRRRRQFHREAAEASMLEDVRKANVVVVNPTRIAVALYYEAGETELPVVLAKGDGELARAIRRIAEDEGIPIVHDVDLARRLRADASVDQYIPEELIEPVAAVLRWVRDLTRP